MDRMGATIDDAKELVDQIIDQQQVLAAAQAKHARLMLTFSNTRRALDHTRITSMRSDGADPRYTPGEFAALEIGLAIKTNKHKITRTIGIARRLHDETPDAWDAWQAGHIDHDRAAQINRALIRLTRDSSKQLLNVLVLDVAVCKPVQTGRSPAISKPTVFGGLVSVALWRGLRPKMNPLTKELKPEPTMLT